ncbi:MAG: DUF3737 family protein [Duncaniella sp.]|nr:DUF3737 family protein [Duncaniella sp.]
MQEIKNAEFGGERPLFASHHLTLDNVTIHAGESALKCCSDITARHCRFEGKYPFWHVDKFSISDCLFTPGARAALWYSRDLTMRDTRVEAPKMFREMDGIDLTNVVIPDAAETLWHCRNIRLRDCDIRQADYLFMHCENIDIDRYHQEGNYSFQYTRNVVIRNAQIHSKDAFWGTEDVTVYDSTLNGEYLGWHSRRLHLIRCHIDGTQPLCYCHDLILEDCTFGPEADLAFEDSTLQARLTSTPVSIKNPRSGSISLPEPCQIITDAHILAPADCKITIR